jgi:biopolymer transport protein TolR
LARREQVRPDMNVTPLVDVVLVLLIIFMVITPQMEKGAVVDLPGIVNTEAPGDSKLEPITLSLTSAGKLFLEKDIVTRAALSDKLRGMREAQPERKLVLKADKLVRWDEVRELFKSCQELGFPGVSLQVGDRNKKGTAPSNDVAAGVPEDDTKGS